MITFSDKSKTFYLDTDHSSYVFRLLDDGSVVHQYYGNRIPHEDIRYHDTFRPVGFSASQKIGDQTVSPETLTMEYPTFGRGDYRTPAVTVLGRDQCQVNDLKYISHQILTGKPLMNGMPQLDVDTDQVQTLKLVLEDSVSGFQAILMYSTFEDVISRRVCIRNISDQNIRIRRICSASLDFQESDFDMVTLNGSWGRERYVNRSPLHCGICSVGSTRGASGHEANPFMALMEKSASEARGDVYGFSLIYSGDFQIIAETDAFASARIQIGLNPETFSWLLKPGEIFESPEALLTYSSDGLNGMSQNFHRVCRSHLGKCADRNIKHPVLINSWEAMYFDFNERKMLQFIDNCAELGIDTIVMDDGWFGCRDDDSTSLGDWNVNKRKLPNGLDPLIEACQKNKINFGIWFEPEMISRCSQLYKAHPDWCIQVPDRRPIEARNQLVLDMSRPEVVTCIYEQMAEILNRYPISYVKWDMNRYITDNCSAALDNDRQGELGFRYMRGVYRLISLIESAFPHVFFEGCAGGGGRFDFGMLYYMPQIWTSDDTDAIERLKIQYGTSMVYPPSVIVAHVSACPNHQTGRTTSIDTRGNVAQAFRLGYEFNPEELSTQEKEKVRNQIIRYREMESLVDRGIFYRLCSPFTTDCCSWQMVSPDQNRAFVLFAWKTCSVQPQPQHIKLQGLNAQKLYWIPQLKIKQSGSVLMNVGIALMAPMRTDYPSITLDLIAEK